MSIDAIARDERSRETLNRALLLYAIGAVNKPVNQTQLQKLIFHAECELRERNLATPHYVFVRWNHGPWSKDIYDDRDALAATGAVKEQTFRWSCGTERTVEISAHGRAVMDAIVAELAHMPGWGEVREALESAADFVRHQSATKLRDWSHQKVVRPDSDAVSRSIHDMEDLAVILDPRRWKDSRVIDRDLLENLDYTLSMNAHDLDELDEVMAEPVSIDELFAR